MARYDIAVIGAGPAAYEAAITATIRNKSVLLVGSSPVSSKLARASRIDNYLGFPQVSGAELAQHMQEHLDVLGISVTPDRVNAVYAMGDYFALQGNETMYEATAVILATGVVSAKPLPGEEEFLGHGVSYCATCDASLYRGKTAVVVGYAPREEAEADFLAEIADHVTYVPMYKDEPHFEHDVEVLRCKPVAIEARESGKALVYDGGEIVANGVFILREAVSPGQLVPGLETEGAHVTVDRRMATNLPGCFACGDITGLPYQYIKAAGEGNVAALSAVSYLAQLKR